MSRFYLPDALYAGQVVELPDNVVRHLNVLRVRCGSYGAQLLPLNLLGFLQYVSPTIALLLAIFYFGESFGTPQMIAFGCIWIALVLFSLSNRITTIKKM